MTFQKNDRVPRILIGVPAHAMAAFTVPAYPNPTLNPGLADLTGPALSLGSTASAFLGRQLTLILIALIGAVVGQRHLVMIGGFALMFMNGHDAILTGLMGGPAAAATAGLAFAITAAIAISLVWLKPDLSFQGAH